MKQATKKKAAATSVKHLDDATFDEEVGDVEGTALVTFSAAWCEPCKVLAPIVEELAEELDEVFFAHVDVDESPRLAARYGIQAMPTIVVFVDGEPTVRQAGLVNRKRLLDLLLTATD